MLRLDLTLSVAELYEIKIAHNALLCKKGNMLNMFQTISPCFEYTPSPIAIVCHIRFSIQHPTCRQKSGMIFASMNNNAF